MLAQTPSLQLSRPSCLFWLPIWPPACLNPFGLTNSVQRVSLTSIDLPTANGEAHSASMPPPKPSSGGPWGGDAPPACCAAFLCWLGRDSGILNRSGEWRTASSNLRDMGRPEPEAMAWVQVCQSVQRLEYAPQPWSFTAKSTLQPSCYLHYALEGCPGLCLVNPDAGRMHIGVSGVMHSPVPNKDKPHTAKSYPKCGMGL